MTLIEAWKDSLQLCKPQAVKLMVLVTLNTMRQVVRTLCALWFLVPMVLLLISAIVIALTFNVFAAYGPLVLLSVFSYSAAFLAVRPSIQIKNWDYFKSYFWLCTQFMSVLFLWMLAIVVILVGWEYLFVPFGHLHSLFAPKNFIFTPVSYIATAPAYLAGIFLFCAHKLHCINYGVFFYLDKAGSVFVSFKKALTLIYYNLPLLLVYETIIWCVLFLLSTLGYTLSIMLMNTGSTVGYVVGGICVMGILFVSALLHLFIFCLVSNIYTKRVHDQYSLYQ